MKLTNKEKLGIASLGLAIIGVWLIFRKKKEATTDYTPNIPIGGDETGGGYTPTQTTTRNDNFPLKKGSKGQRVKELQKIILSINPNILPKYGADGDFGSETEAALLSISGKKSVDNQSELEGLRYSKSRFY